MITAALHGQAVSPRPLSPAPALDAPPLSSDHTPALAQLTAEIAERLEEMDSLKHGSGRDFVIRLATVARTNADAYTLLTAVLHGRTEALLDSYAAQAHATGREKQTMHYRTHQAIVYLREHFPAMAAVLETIRDSVRHHEDPLSRPDALRRSAAPSAEGD